MNRPFSSRSTLFLAATALATVGAFAPLPGQTQRFEPLHRMLPIERERTRDVALGDIDGDGDLDALVGNDGYDRIYVNDGTGRFTGRSDASTGVLVTDPVRSARGLGRRRRPGCAGRQ